MDCKEAKKLVVPFREGSLNSLKTAQFMKHLKNCRSCYEELEMACLSSMVSENLNNEREEYNLDREVKRVIRLRKKHLRISLFLLILDLLLAAGIITVLVLLLNGKL